MSIYYMKLDILLLLKRLHNVIKRIYNLIAKYSAVIQV